MATDTVFRLSFLKIMNHVKGINQPVNIEEVEEEWLEKKAPEETRRKW